MVLCIFSVSIKTQQYGNALNISPRQISVWCRALYVGNLRNQFVSPFRNMCFLSPIPVFQSSHIRHACLPRRWWDNVDCLLRENMYQKHSWYLAFGVGWVKYAHPVMLEIPSENTVGTRYQPHTVTTLCC